MPIPVIDLFAGPGGLSEGFAAFKRKELYPFDIRLSIEKDENAHQTLLLRTFFRQFLKKGNTVPSEYYDMLHEPNILLRDEKKNLLFAKYKQEFDDAAKEALCMELSEKNRGYIQDLISNSLQQSLLQDWVLIGGPPCQAYSNVGRARIGGIYSSDSRVFLYKEYLRIIAYNNPAIFVLENVEGLLSAEVHDNNIFESILTSLEKPSSIFKRSNSSNYTIYSLSNIDIHSRKDFIVKSEKYGIPQKRHRVILIGIRNDIRSRPRILEVQPIVPIRSVIGLMPKLRSGLSKSFLKSEVVGKKTHRHYKKLEDSTENWLKNIGIIQSDIRALNGFSFLGYNEDLRKFTRGEEFISCESSLDKDHPLFQWFTDAQLQGVTNHVTRTHLLQDLRRYFFCAIFSEYYKRFPKLKDLAVHSKSLLPDHKNVSTGKFEDRFRVLMPDQPSATITSHIAKDGHAFIHYDPFQCRSLTVREAARIQTFPDNYLFCGSRTKQFHQVGNAVPPYLASQIAKIVLGVLS